MVIDSTWVQQQISANSALTAGQVEGELYYRGKNTFILSKKKSRWTTDSEGNSVLVDDWKSNMQVPSGFFSILTDQKVNYSVNEDIEGKLGGRSLTDILGNSWIYDTQRAGMEAAQKGYAVYQIYLKGNKVKRKRIPAEQCIPCFVDDILEAMIRTYTATDDKGKAVDKCEVWDKEKHYYYERKNGDDWKFLKEEYHLMSVTTCGSLTEEDGIGWGVPPFAVMLNNSYRDSDLQKVKNQIDAYDLTLSELVNTVDDYGKPIFVFNNYGGSAVVDMMRSLNKWRAMHGDDDSNIDIKQIAIDAEARVKTIDQLQTAIFRDGQGVDGSKMVGNVTNYQISSMYMGLNMKANGFEQQVTDFLKQLVSFYVTPSGSQIDPEETFDLPLEINYVRKPIEDEIALMTISNQSVGSLTDETRLSRDPRVLDPKKEAKRLSAEMIVPPTKQEIDDGQV